METNCIILDAAYDTRTAGSLMGGLHPNDVNRLISEGKIQGRLRRVRGSKGRTVVLGAEIKRFNDGLPVKPAADSMFEPKAARPRPSTPKPPRRRKDGTLIGVKVW